MNWFWTALAATLCWGFADLFYKRGADAQEPDTHLKTAVFVGLCFGAHAIFTLLTGDVGFDPRNLLRYAPVSGAYILSMVLGWMGLRRLELSIVSPVSNSSGAATALLSILILHELPDSALSWCGIVLCVLGVFLLGLFEKGRGARIPEEDRRYRVGFAAFLLPVGYCIVDALGTFLDDPCLSMETTWLLGVTEETIEDVGNTAYELTYLLLALVLLAVLAVRAKRRGERLKLLRRSNGSRLLAACFETAGQFAYVHVIGGNAVVAAPMIASYCVVSVLLSRLLLHERLPRRQYASILITLLGVLLLGLADGLTGSY